MGLSIIFLTISRILGCFRKKDAEVIFRDAKELQMTGEGYVWIVTEQALDAVNVPEGTIGLQLVNYTNELAHIRDSMLVDLQNAGK